MNRAGSVSTGFPRLKAALRSAARRSAVGRSAVGRSAVGRSAVGCRVQRCRALLLWASAWAICAGLLLGPVHSVDAQDAAVEAPPTAASVPHPYRMILAPLTQIERLAQGEYRTVLRTEFEARLRALQSRLPASLKQGATVTQAAYIGRLEGHQRLTGTAVWQIRQLSDGASWVSMGQPNLALSDVRWLSDEGESVDAEFGSRGTAECQLRVTQSGTLQTHWTLAAQADTPEALVFELQLPPAPVHRFDLQIPREYEVVCSQGVARRIELAADPAAVESGLADAAEVSLWQLDLGGSTHCRLELRRPQAQDRSVALRQLVRYSLSERGVELTADLFLDCDQTDVSQLVLQLAPHLRITRVVVENEVLPDWATATEAERGNLATLLFAKPLSGRNRLVRVSAVAPPSLEPLRELPRLRVAGVDWQQESLRLKVIAPLTLEALSLTRAVRVPLVNGEPLDPVPTIAIQCQDPEYQVGLVLGQQAAQIELKSATRIEVGANEILATMSVNLRSRSGTNFELTGSLPEQWNLESIEAERPELMDEWQVVSSPTAPRQLQVRFAQALPSDTWMQLTILARRPVQIGLTPLPLEQLRPLILAAPAAAPRQFLVVQASAATEVEFPQDGQMTWLSLDDLDLRETRLLGAQMPERLVLLDERTLRQTVVLRERLEEAAVGGAKIEITASYANRTASERYRILVERVSGPLRKLHVRLSEARTGDMRWYLDESLQRELAARRVVRSEQDAGELWEIDWPELTDPTAVLVGERSWPLRDRETISLARVVEALTQDGNLLIEGTSEMRLSEQETPFLTPLPSGQQRFQQLTARRYAFRYTPLADVFSQGNLLSVQFAPPAAGTAATSPLVAVWRQITDTQVDQAGAARQAARLWVENLGADQLVVRLPASAQLRQVLVNGREASYSPLEPDRLRIALPAEDRFPCLQLRYDTLGPALGWRQVYPWQPVEVEAVVLAHDWRLWTPPEFQLIHRAPAGVRARLNGLLGPLQRHAGERPFDLFSADSWQAVTARWQSNPPLNPRTHQVVEWLGQQDVTTVADWLQKSAALGIWVDAAGLAELGITPRTPWAVSAHNSGLARGRERLELAGLALIQLANGWVLCPESTLAWNEAARPTELGGSIVAWDEGQIVGGRFVLRPGVTLPGELQEAHRWQAWPFPWRDAPTETGPYVAAGWRLSALPPTPEQTAVVYRRSFLQLQQTASLILALGVSWWARRHGLRRAGLPVLVALAGALVLPAPLDSLARFAWWGSLGGLLLPDRQRSSRSIAADRSTQSQRPSRVAAQATLGGLIGLLWVDAALAQPSSQPAALPPAALSSGTVTAEPWEIYVEADAEGLPATDYLFLPKELHRQLFAEGAPDSARVPAWILSKSTYVGALEQADSGSQLQLTGITADFELWVTQTVNAVEFPFAPEAIAALKREAFLDGRMIQLQGEADRAVIKVPIRQAGRHHLQLSFHTLTVTDAGRARISLPIPRSPQAVLQLTSPQDLRAVQVPSARGLLEVREATGQLLADLGPTDTLRIEWPTGPAENPLPAITQLSWLKLARDAVRLDTQLLVDTRRFRDGTLVLEADERLQLDVAISTPPLALAPAETAGVRRLEFDVSQELGEQATIQLSFLVNGLTGIGHVRFPSLRVVDHPVKQHVAVSAAAGLVLRVEPGNGGSLPTAEFMRQWGGQVAPDYAYQFNQELRGWECQGQWSSPASQADVQAAYLLSGDRTRMLLMANLRGDPGATFQQPLQLPPDMVLENVQVLPSGATTAVRWSAQPDGAVMLFFSQPLRGPYQLGLVGSVPATMPQRRHLPMVKFLNTPLAIQRLDVYRRSDVLVSADLPIGAEPADMPLFLRNQLGLSRWVAGWSGEIPASPQVDVTANARQLQAKLTNVVSREQGTWLQRLQVDLQMEQGVLDSLTFEIPEEWKAGVQETTDLAVQFSQSPRPHTVRVTLWPRLKPIDPRQTLFPGGSIPVTAGQPLSVPNVRLLESAQIERRLFLPVVVDNQPVLWNTIGLEPLGEDQPPGPLTAPRTTYRGYRITGESFQATRLPAKSAAGQPVVQLADLHYAWQGPGQLQGLALYDVQPDGRNECELLLPPGVTPLILAVEDQPCEWESRPQPESAGGSQVRIRLTSNELPQQVRLLFAATLAQVAQTGKVELPLPRLAYRAEAAGAEAVAEMRVERTLRTVYNLAPGNWIVPGNQASLVELQRQRLAHLAEVGEVAARLATDFATTDLQRWYSVWGERFVAAVSASQQTRMGAPADAAISLEILNQLKAQHLETAKQLQVETTYQELLADAATSDALSVWRLSLATPRAVWGWSDAGAAAPLVMGQQQLTTRPWLAPLVAVACLAVAVGSQRWPRRSLAFGRRWPCALGVLLGLAWWLWLDPSLVGWLIVGLSLFVWALLR